MEVEALHSHPSHGMHAEHSVALFRDKFWLSFVLTFPVVFWSAAVQRWFGYKAPSFPGSSLIPAFLGTTMLLYGGSIFIKGAARELSARQPGMMSLISLALIVAFSASIAATLGVFDVDVWWELSTLITVMLLGHWLEMRATNQARGALSALAALLPDSAERITDAAVETVPLADLRVGDTVLVRPGSRVPADGTVLQGTADLDESVITGESRVIFKTPGSTVVGGTIAEGGSLHIRLTAVGERTTLSGIVRLVAAAQGSSSRAQSLADRAAAFLFYIAVVVGALTFSYWWIVGDREHAFVRTATVLVIACPHALGLAIPLVIAISTALGARNGLLVKDRLALEEARRLDVVIFDKTGTLTRGLPTLSGIAVISGMAQATLLALAAAVEADSEHPTARAIVSKSRQLGDQPEVSTEFEALPGVGVRANVKGHTVAVGGPNLLRNAGVVIPSELAESVRIWEFEGRTILYILRDGILVGSLALEDEIRGESFEAVRALHKLGIHVAMITGDSQSVANVVAKRLGIDAVAAQVLPAEKVSVVQEFQASGQKVAMVGDGVNDAPALAAANIGIAIGAGTDVALESAGIVLVRSDPRDVVRAISLSRAAHRKMVQNLVWATAYNAVAIPAAAGAFVHWGIALPMGIGALAMNLSTVIVAINAQFLHQLKL